MSGVGDWLHLMASSVSVNAATTSLDAYGKPSYSSTTTVYRCRIEGPTRFNHTATNTQMVSSYTLYVAATASLPVIGPKDKITMPAGFPLTNPPILQVEPVFDGKTIHHHVVRLG